MPLPDDDKLGPTLAASRALLAAMERRPVCVACPAAQWYRIDDDKGGQELECFCTQFRGIMYDRRRRVVAACDGRADAVATMARRPTRD